MCWTLLVMILTCGLVGWLAQSWKGRTGAFWGLLTLLFELLAALLLFAMRYAGRLRPFWSRPMVWSRVTALGIMAALAVGFVMALLVATLPLRHDGG